MKKFLVALAVLAAAPALAQTASVPDWPACEVQSEWQSNTNTASVARMRVARGGTCAVVRTGSPARYELVNPPRNGTVTVAGNRATYVPAASFSGADAFVLRVRLSSGGTMAPWFVTINVEVR